MSWRRNGCRLIVVLPCGANGTPRVVVATFFSQAMWCASGAWRMAASGERPGLEQSRASNLVPFWMCALMKPNLQAMFCPPTFRRAWAAWLLALFAGLAAPVASAQYVMEFAQTYNAPVSNFITSTFLNQQALIEATRPGASQASPAAFPLAPPQAERSAAELAKAAPAAQRMKLEKIYLQLMPAYHQLEKKLGWPVDDVAGAMAALLAGNHMAMTGTELSDESVTAAGDQLRASASVQKLLNQLSPADRRRLYEQCAMLGMFMALANKTSQQQPANVVANLRNSARGNLRVVIGDAADTLRFTARGLQSR